MKIIPASAVLLVLAAAPAAQIPTHISPAAAAAGLGGSNNNAPFSIIPTHYQQVHDRTAFSNPTPALFNLLRFRMATGFVNRPGFMIDVELHIANSPNDSGSASQTFANNISPGTEVNVFTRKQVNLPTVPDNSWSIAPFPFDQPFAFIASTHLSWRAVVWGNSNNNTSFTYPLDAWSGSAGTSANNGPATGCRSANGSANATHVATIGAPGANSAFSASSFVPAGGLPAVLAIGASATAWGGIPLPFDMTPIGAPSCFLRNDILLTFGGITQANSTGSVSISVPVPSDPSLAGATFRSQYLFIELAANPLGVFTSNGLTNVLGRSHGVTRLYNRGDPRGTMSTIFGPGFGLATGFN
jgi:hypothetical protein